MLKSFLLLDIKDDKSLYSNSIFISTVIMVIQVVACILFAVLNLGSIPFFISLATILCLVFNFFMILEINKYISRKNERNSVDLLHLRSRNNRLESRINSLLQNNRPVRTEVDRWENDNEREWKRICLNKMFGENVNNRDYTGVSIVLAAEELGVDIGYIPEKIKKDLEEII